MSLGRISFRHFGFGLLLVLVGAARAVPVHASGFFASVGLGGGLPDFDPAAAIKIERLVGRPMSLGDGGWSTLDGSAKYRPNYRGDSGLRGEFGYRLDNGYILGVEVLRDNFRVRGSLSDNDCERKFGKRGCFKVKRRVWGPRGRGDRLYEVDKFTARNPGMNVEALAVSVCYSPLRSLDGRPVLYGCAKAGAGVVEAWGVRGDIKPILGCKVGMELSLGNKVSAYGEAYYHSLGDVIGKARIERNGRTITKGQSVRTKIVDVKYVGGTAGLRVSF